jgi:precorrin-2 dehydrogenase/sirohydrochlorin ferrochelatase
MNWTPIYLNCKNRNVLIIGSGEVGERRAKRFLDVGANVIISGGNNIPHLEKLGAIFKPLDDIESLVKWCNIVILASGDTEINNKISALAEGKIINRADYPEKGNIIIPTTFSLGDAQISIYTGGKSPLVAKLLREKIESIITNEDLLQIELQDYIRRQLKNKISNQRIRRNYLYEISENKIILKYLKDDDLESAKKYADDYINKHILKDM